MERFENIKKHLVTYSGPDTQPVYTNAYGARFVDENGNEYLCLNDIANILGFQNPKFTGGVSELVKTQLLCHAGNLSEAKEKLIRNFMEVTGGDFDRIFISGSGGETVDWAVKIARRFTGRDGIISFTNALHGRSFSGAFLSGIPTRKANFGSGLENVHFWDYPADGRAFEPSADSYNDIAAVIIEPYQAAGGMDSPSPEYWKWLRSYTEERGILIIMDEIQTGFGKTGSFFAYKDAGIVPDILLAGKGMSNGFGMGALLMTKEVGSCMGLEMSGGSADNNLQCSIVNLVFDIMREDDILGNVNRIGALLKDGIKRALDEKGIPHKFHGKGLFLSVELPDGIADIFREKAAKARILTPKHKNRIVIRTPLTLSEEDVNWFLKVLNESF